MNRTANRRRFLQLGVSAGALGLAGCGTRQTDGKEPDTQTTSPVTSTETTGPEAETATTPSKEDSPPEPLDTVRSIGAHYYLWYGEPLHAHRNGKWSRESPSTPVLGNYNSANTDVIAQHINWCHIAGISWLNVSWWGPESHHDHRLREDILTHPRADELDWSILYETGGRFESLPPDMDAQGNRRRLRHDLEYLADTYFEQESYKRIDGRPVLYIYSANALGQIGTLVDAYESAVAAAGTRPYLIADITDPSTYGAPAITKIADAVTIYNPYIAHPDIEDFFLEHVEQAYKSLYLAQEYAEPDVIPTVIPGFNDSEVTHVSRDNPVLACSPERYARVAETTLPYASGPIFVTSFNEWYENTQIEPSDTHGDAYLQLTAELLATAPRSPPEITGDTFALRFEKLVPEATLNPDLEHGRSLTMLCRRLRMYDEGGALRYQIDVGGAETDTLFLMGAYEKGQNGTDTWRWFGSNSTTLIHLPEIPAQGTLEIDGRGAADMEVTLQIDGRTRGTGNILTEDDTYRIEFQ